jgi:hypothetical protein
MAALRTHTLRAPVLLGSLTSKTGPPPPFPRSSFRIAYDICTYRETRRKIPIGGENPQANKEVFIKERLNDGVSDRVTSAFLMVMSVSLPS